METKYTPQNTTDGLILKINIAPSKWRKLQWCSLETVSKTIHRVPCCIWCACQRASTTGLSYTVIGEPKQFFQQNSNHAHTSEKLCGKQIISKKVWYHNGGKISPQISQARKNLISVNSKTDSASIEISPKRVLSYNHKEKTSDEHELCNQKNSHF